MADANKKLIISKDIPAGFVKPVQKEGIIRLEEFELPIITILDLSEGVFRSPDGETKFGDADTFSFVPFRLDYFPDPYTGQRSAWLSSVVLQSTRIPTGAIAAIRLRQNNSNNGGLNNFEQMDNLIRKGTGRHMATWCWKSKLTRMTGSGVNPDTGKVEARKWYKATWLVREPESDNELLIRQELGAAFEEHQAFETLVPLQKVLALIPAPVGELPQGQEQKALPSA